jgi:quinol monooxygenase YgiN
MALRLFSVLGSGETDKGLPMIYVIAELRIRTEMAEKAYAAARKMVTATLKEDGCISYDMHHSVTDPSSLVVVERWSSREALSRHLETPHFKGWRTTGAEFIVGRKVEVVAPANVEPL